MFLGQSSFTGNINVVNKTQYFPKVASDGGKNIMIVSYFDYTATDQDVISYSSSSGALGPFTMQYISTSTDVEQYPKVTGKYFSNGSFYCSAKRSNTGAGTGSILYRSATHNSWNSYYQLQNDSLAGYSAYDSRPGFRFVNNDSCFAVWSGSGVLYSSAGCNGSGSYVFTKNLQLRVLMEGPYLPASNRMLRGDTIRVYVRNTSPPYNIVDSAKGAIDTGRTGYFSFANVNNNVNYFIVVKSRNTIETWSKPGGEKFINNVLNFDFTPSNIQAFGGNEKRIDSSPFSYGVFSGDVYS